MSLWSYVKSIFVKKPTVTTTTIAPTKQPAAVSVHVGTTAPSGGIKVVGTYTRKGGGGARGAGTIADVSGVTQEQAEKLEEPIPIPTPSPKEIAKDVPISGVISAAEPPTFKTIYSITKERIRRDPSKTLQHLYQAGRMVIKKKEPAEEFVEKVEEKITGAVAGVYPLTRAEKRQQEQVETFNEESRELDKDIQDYNKKYGDKTLPRKEHDIATAEGEKLSARIERRKVVAENLERRGIELEEKAKKTTPETLSRAAALGVVSAVTTIPKFVVSPVETTKEFVGGLQELPEQIAEAPGPTIAGVVGSLATFYVGGRIVGRVIKGKPVDPVKLNTAIKGAEVKIKSTKGVTTETQLKTYKIPGEQRAELVGEINLGRSVRVTEYDITHINPASRKIINQAFPNRKITSIEVVDASGNIISRKTLVGVEIRKGVIEYKDYTTGQGAGIYDPKARVAEVETTYIRGKPGKPAAEIFKEKEVIKITEPKYIRTPTGEIMRGVEAKAKVYKGARKVAMEQEPITFESLQKVIEAEKFGKYPVRKVKVTEIQTLKELKIAEGYIPLKGGDVVALLGKEKKFVVKKGVGKAERIPEPIEFKYSKAMDPFDLGKIDLGKKVDLGKPIDLGKKVDLGVVEKVKPVKLDVAQLPAADLTPQIIKGIEAVGKDITKIKTEVAAPVELSTKELEAQIQKVWESQGVVSPQLEKLLKKQREKEKQIMAQRVAPVQTVIPIQAVAPKIAQRPMLTEKQLQKLIQPTQLIMPRIQIPKLDIPKIPGPIIPIPFPFIPKKPKGLQKQYKELRKAQEPIFGYAASLAAAAAQRRPFKVTRKQYKKLKKRIYLGTEARPVLEIVPEEEIKKAVKESVEF